MTTIAFDGKTMAGDSLVDGAMYVRYNFKKVRKIGDKIIGCSGIAQENELVFEYFSKNMDKPKLTDVSGLIYSNDKIYKFEDNLVLMSIEAPVAVGCGAAIAMAAMMCGKTAREAVEIASVLDIYTGGDIIEIEIE